MRTWLGSAPMDAAAVRLPNGGAVLSPEFMQAHNGTDRVGGRAGAGTAVAVPQPRSLPDPLSPCSRPCVLTRFVTRPRSTLQSERSAWTNC